MDLLGLIGGLSLFLFGMTVMGQALERRAGGGLEIMLSKLTSGKIRGLLTGLGVTAIIQSSSATTVMVVGFVNSGLMSLGQAINVIMGANIGTTVTSWILSLSGISGKNPFIQMLKPSNFSPILALIGVVLLIFTKSTKKKDTGTILLGFATLMFGMDAMSAAVAGLKDAEWFTEMFVMFSNPLLGVLVGALVTAVIQSSSASVGILQALAATGRVTLGSSIPIIMGQNIGTCVTAMLSSVGTNKNARRAALVHLFFNIIGTVIFVALYMIVSPFIAGFLAGPATALSIAICHSLFNVFCTVILFPASSLLEKLAYRLIRDTESPDKNEELDERLLLTPQIALERCRELICEMGNEAVLAMKEATLSLDEYTDERARKIRAIEEHSDHYEDIIATYLLRLSEKQLDSKSGAEATLYLKAIGDFERISDHAVNVLESAEELREKKIDFTEGAKAELLRMREAVTEILELSMDVCRNHNTELADSVEPLETVIDRMKENMRTAHIKRLVDGKCSIEAGFVWSDLLTNFERTADHCSNIAGGILDAASGNMDIHRVLRAKKESADTFTSLYERYREKYLA